MTRTSRRCATTEPPGDDQRSALQTSTRKATAGQRRPRTGSGARAAAVSGRALASPVPANERTPTGQAEFPAACPRRRSSRAAPWGHGAALGSSPLRCLCVPVSWARFLDCASQAALDRSQAVAHHAHLCQGERAAVHEPLGVDRGGGRRRRCRVQSGSSCSSRRRGHAPPSQTTGPASRRTRASTSDAMFGPRHPPDPGSSSTTSGCWSSGESETDLLTRSAVSLTACETLKSHVERV